MSGMMGEVMGWMMGGMKWRAPSTESRVSDTLVADVPSTSSPMVLEAKVISVSSPDLD
jgi:hypothetical protein